MISWKWKKIGRPLHGFRGRLKLVLLHVLTVMGSEGCTRTGPADVTSKQSWRQGTLCSSYSIATTCYRHNHRGDKDTKWPVAYSREASVEDNQPINQSGLFIAPPPLWREAPAPFCLWGPQNDRAQVKHPGGYSHWLQYAYARTARVPFWHISVPLRVGFWSNVPLRVGFLTPNSVPQRVWFFQNLCQKESRR